jgi:hypothetical protein
MNCQLCQKESDAYRVGKLSEDMRTQVEEHLQICADCADSYRMQTILDGVINQERSITPDLYLTTRIMERIEKSEETAHETISPFIRILRPVLIMTSMAAAIFAGVLIGNIYLPSDRAMSKPIELSMIDDVTIESIDILSIE